MTAPTAQELAKRFHEAYERLAPAYGYETRKESAVAWENVPEKNRLLMAAVCHEVMLPALVEAGARGRNDPETFAHEQRLVNKLNYWRAENKSLREALQHMADSDDGYLPDGCTGCMEVKGLLDLPKTPSDEPTRWSLKDIEQARAEGERIGREALEDRIEVLAQLYEARSVHNQSVHWLEHAKEIRALRGKP